MAATPRGTDEVHGVSRRLRSRCEAIFGAMFYVPEYMEGVFGLNTTQWYMAGRVAPLGAVPAEVGIAVLGTFNPRLVHAGLDGVWDHVTPEQVVTRRTESAARWLAEKVPMQPDELARAIELLEPGMDAAEPAGAPIYAAMAVLPRPTDPVALLWRLCDLVREHRSGAHVGAWRSFGFAPVEICVLNDLWRGGRAGATAHNDMTWPMAAVDAALARLAEQGLAATDEPGGTITDAGRAIREDVERATSAQQASIVHALGSDADELLGLLDPWAHAAKSRYRS